MSEFNFNSQICTSREQSERLLALGLKKETADMCYKVATHDRRGHEIPEKDKHYSICCWYDELNIVCGFEQVKTIPAWSLGRLIEMIPEYFASTKLEFRSEAIKWLMQQEGNVYDNLVILIADCIKNAIFNKEYLV